MKKIQKGEKGITLIALVITIIVLLILAGISIAMLLGDSGIITMATKAEQETKEAQLEESLNLMISSLNIENIGTDNIQNNSSSRSYIENRMVAEGVIREIPLYEEDPLNRTTEGIIVGDEDYKFYTAFATDRNGDIITVLMVECSDTESIVAALNMETGAQMNAHKVNHPVEQLVVLDEYSYNKITSVMYTILENSTVY